MMTRRLVTVLVAFIYLAATVLIMAVLSTGCYDFEGLSTGWAVGTWDLTSASDGAPLNVADLGPADEGTSPAGDLATMGPVDALMAPDTAPADLGVTCAGYVSPVLGGCWYVSGQNTTCNATCATHGGFDADAARHKGDPTTRYFFPNSLLVNPTPSAFELYNSTNNRRFGANGADPDPSENGGFAMLACACRN